MGIGQRGDANTQWHTDEVFATFAAPEDDIDAIEVSFRSVWTPFTDVPIQPACRQELLVVVALVTGVISAGPAAAQPTDPADLPEPTSDQLAASVRVWIRRAPFACGTPRTVSTLEKQATEGAETVLSLDTDILFAFDSADLPRARDLRSRRCFSPSRPPPPCRSLGTRIRWARTRTTWVCPSGAPRPSPQRSPRRDPTCH